MTTLMVTDLISDLECPSDFFARENDLSALIGISREKHDLIAWLQMLVTLDALDNADKTNRETTNAR